MADRWTRRLLALLALLYGLLLAANTWLPPGVMQPWRDQFGLVILGLGIVTALTLPYMSWRIGNLISQRHTADAATELCRQFVVAFQKQLESQGAKVPDASLSAAIWQVRRGWPGFRHVVGCIFRDRRLPRFFVLEHAGYWAYQRRIIKKQVRWTYGKGVNGLCWMEAQDVRGDLSGLHKLGNKGSKEFNRAPAGDRLHLTWNEWEYNAKSYWTIYATPLANHERKFVGCLSIGCTTGGSAKAFEKAWSAVAVGGYALLAEGTLGR